MGNWSKLLPMIGGVAGAVGAATGNPAGGALGTILPIAGSVASEIHAGIQRRREIEYNSPKNQVKRLREAGLPTAAGSNITGGQMQAASVGKDNYGTTALNDNLGKSITKQIDRKKLQIHGEELRSAQAKADLDKGEAKNKLNPRGKFENTNQGLGQQQALTIESEAIKGAQIVNKWMPLEKAQAILKNTKEIAKISADTANSLAQNSIIVADGKIKNILADYQERMSSQELTNIIRRNTGLTNANAISAIQGEILRNTKLAQIQSAWYAAAAAGQNVQANQLGLLVKALETDSAKAYYRVRARIDDSYDKGLLKGGIINPRDLIYLQMFTPKESSINFGTMSNIFK